MRLPRPLPHNLFGFDLGHHLALVIAAVRADPVRFPGVVALRAKGGMREANASLPAAPFVPPALAGPSLGDGHDFLSKSPVRPGKIPGLVSSSFAQAPERGKGGIPALFRTATAFFRIKVRAATGAETPAGR